MGLGVGYGSLILLNLVAMPLMLNLGIFDVGSGMLLVVVTYLPLILALVIPPALVYVVFRYLQSRSGNAR